MLRDHLDVLLQPRAAQLGGQQLVDLEDAGRVVHGDLDRHGALLARLDLHPVDGGGRQRVDVRPAVLERHPRAALGEVERVGHAHDPGLDGDRVAAAAVADDRVQRLGHDHRALGLLVDVPEQGGQPLGGQEQAVGLVVGAVDRHAGVVEEAGGGDHHLGVVVAHQVRGHHGRLDPALGQQPVHPQRDVQHDPDVHPRVVGHAEAVGEHVLHVPPGAQAVVGVGGLQEAPPAAGCRARARPPSPRPTASRERRARRVARAAWRRPRAQTTPRVPATIHRWRRDAGAADRRFSLRASLKPFGIGEQRPNNFGEVTRAVWENRDRPGYAWRILDRGRMRRLRARHEGHARLDHRRRAPLQHPPAPAAAEHHARVRPGAARRRRGAARSAPAPSCASWAGCRARWSAARATRASPRSSWDEALDLAVGAHPSSRPRARGRLPDQPRHRATRPTTPRRRRCAPWAPTPSTTPRACATRPARSG